MRNGKDIYNRNDQQAINGEKQTNLLAMYEQRDVRMIPKASSFHWQCMLFIARQAAVKKLLDLYICKSMKT